VVEEQHKKEQEGNLYASYMWGGLIMLKGGTVS
jgi:hypothetical protein